MMYTACNMAFYDEPLVGKTEEELDAAAFNEEMSRQFSLFMKAHFGDPACEECLKNFPD